MRTAYITHASCSKHQMGADHPECPERLHAINDQLIASGLLDHLIHYDAVPASKAQLVQVHDQAYVEWARKPFGTVGYGSTREKVQEPTGKALRKMTMYPATMFAMDDEEPRENTTPRKSDTPLKAGDSDPGM